MEWLRALRGKLRREEGPADDEPITTAGAVAPNRPPLMLLMPETGSTSAFKLEVFADAAGADSFLNFWFCAEQLEGVVVFWALTWRPTRASRPGGAPPAEPLVIIRDPGRPGVVFPFSYSDMAIAEDFLRREVERGLDLDLVSLYWAAPLRTLVDPRGNIYVDPALPPLPMRIDMDLDADLLKEARAEADRARIRREAEQRVRKVMEQAVRESRRRRDRQPKTPEQAAYDQFRREIEALGEFDGRPPELAPGVRRAIEEILSGAEPAIGDEPTTEELTDELKRMRDELERFREQRRRWAERQEPFEGFDSPQGKF